jgi:hypothetical protein
MFQKISSFFRGGTPPKSGPLVQEPSAPSNGSSSSASRQQTFTKVFRWRLPEGQTKEPVKVEVIGSFTKWQKIPMMRDSVLDAWHVTLHHIQGNRTHHYMLLVDDAPYYDRTADGVATPHGPDEERWAVQTEKGPRVLMLWAQTK